MQGKPIKDISKWLNDNNNNNIGSGNEFNKRYVSDKYLAIITTLVVVVVVVVRYESVKQ